ncbi:MAG: hypothetical protein ACRCSK_01740 [Fusobacteriaceae bacterium]
MLNKFMKFGNLKTQEGALYKKYLEKICALSYLFSDSNNVYLYYRAHENIFCKSFNAKNLSRDDCSIDALKNSVGIGLKTFLSNGNSSFQKIAEFNKANSSYSNYKSDPEKLAATVSMLRNERLEFAKGLFSANELLYHCIVRENNKLKIFEEPMELININNIKLADKTSEKSIHFSDGQHDYNFNLSKSTLLKKFHVKNFEEININILDDPFDFLLNCDFDLFKDIPQEENLKEFVILPLYSDRQNEVQSKSALNQWNAGGRDRNINEVYIPVPAMIHKEYPLFFPSREHSFNLTLPDGQILDAKLCQDGDKGLMSNPNKKLGEWLLRKVLLLKERELLTMEILERKGIDSVMISKNGDFDYSINFKELGSFERFKKLGREKFFDNDSYYSDEN